MRSGSPPPENSIRIVIWVFQQPYDATKSADTTSQWLKIQHIKIMKCPGHSPDHNSIKSSIKNSKSVLCCYTFKIWGIMRDFVPKSGLNCVSSLFLIIWNVQKRFLLKIIIPPNFYNNGMQGGQILFSTGISQFIFFLLNNLPFLTDLLLITFLFIT